MAATAQDLYLVLRVRNETTRALNQFSTGFSRMAKDARTAGLQAQRAHEMAAVGALKQAQAQGRMASSSAVADRAAIAQRISTESLTRSYKQLEIAQLQVLNAQLRGQQGSQKQIAANRAAILARRGEINEINEEILSLRALSNEKQREIIANRDVAAQMDKDIATRRAAVATIDQDIKKTNEATEARKKHAAGLANVGQAMESAGLVMAAAGIIGVVGLKKMTDATVEYQRTVALTMTQVDGQKTSLKELSDIAIRVGDQIGAPFEQLQGGLYDIFSSMDITVKQSEGVLRAFAKTAVAGQVDIETSGRATIAIMNAFHIPVEQVNRVMDVQFQLVRKGVGTYEQFATVIGRAIPSAARAGQSVETLAGMMAYLTRNGLSAAMAAASAGRAFDAFSHPATVDRLEAMGITVKKGVTSFRSLAQVMPEVETALKKLPLTDREKQLHKLGVAARDNKGEFRSFSDVAGDLEVALNKMSNPQRAKFLAQLGVTAKQTKGEFRPFVDILKDLQFKLKDMTSPERAKALQALFKGSGGTIQARRFYDAVLKNKKSLDDFTTLVTAMQKSAGEADKAYAAMADTVAVKTETMKNRFKILKIQLGSELIPALTKLIEHISAGLTWFNNLSEGQKKWIAIGAAVTAGFLLLAGVVISITGFFIAMAAAAALAEVSLLAVMGTVGLIIVVVFAFIAVWILAYKKIGWFHDAVNWWFSHLGKLAVWLWESAIKPAFHGIVVGAQAVWNALKTAFNWITDTGVPAVGDAAMWLWDQMKAAWDGITSGGRQLSDNLKMMWAVVVGAFQYVGDKATWLWKTILEPAFRGMGAVVMWWYNVAIKPVFDRVLIGINILWAGMQVAFGLMQIYWKLVGTWFKMIYEVFIKTTFDVLMKYFGIVANQAKMWFGIIKDAFRLMGEYFVFIWRNQVKPIIDGAVTAFKFLKDVVTAQMRLIGDIIKFVWEKEIKPKMTFLANVIKDYVVPGFKLGVSMLKTAWDVVKEVAKAPIKFVVETVLNNGILAAYNKLAELFKVSPRNVHVGLPKGFAEGGHITGPGGPREDKVPIWASNGEFIVNARSAARYGNQLRAINAGKFADGGLIGGLKGAGNWLKDKASATVELLKDPKKAIGGLIDNALGFMKNKVLDSSLGQVVKGMGTKVVGGIKDKLLSLSASGELGGGDPGSGKFNTRGGWPPKRGQGPPWSPNVASAANFIRNSWPGMSIGSYTSQYSWSDHYPKAIDNMTNASSASGLARGNAIASWFAANPNAFGTNYIIWNRRITNGQGWGPYSVPGQGPHTDHVHLSFYKDGGRVARSARKTVEGNGDFLATLRPGEMVLPPKYHSGGIVGGGGQRLPLPPAYTGGGGPTQVSQQISIYTQEIDPRLHAEQIGWELARRF